MYTHPTLKQMLFCRAHMCGAHVRIVSGRWPTRWRPSARALVETNVVLPRAHMWRAHAHFPRQVANEVETEQILDAGVDYRTGLPLISSLVQVGFVVFVSSSSSDVATWCVRGACACRTLEHLHLHLTRAAPVCGLQLPPPGEKQCVSAWLLPGAALTCVLPSWCSYEAPCPCTGASSRPPSAPSPTSSCRTLTQCLRCGTQHGQPGGGVARRCSTRPPWLGHPPHRPPWLRHLPPGTQRPAAPPVPTRTPHARTRHTHTHARPQATALHFADLRSRYGDPLVVLNLLKSHERRPREMLLRRELALAVHMLNSQVQVRRWWWRRQWW